MIISAARRTGKDRFVKRYVNKTNRTVLVPTDYMAEEFNEGMFIQNAKSVTQKLRDSYFPWGLVLMEPAMYPKGLFTKIIDKYENQIDLIIGTPLSFEDEFSRYLQKNAHKVIRWSWAAEQPWQSEASYTEATGEFDFL